MNIAKVWSQLFAKSFKRARYFPVKTRICSMTSSVLENESVLPISAEPLEHPDYFNVKQMVNMRELFNARVHLGHHEGTWNSLTSPYIHGLRSTQHVINLEKTVECLQCALNVLSHIVYRKGIVLFLSTNPKYDFAVQKAARNSGEYFITRGWQKGMFTASNKMLGTDKLPDIIIALNLSRFEKSREAIMEAAMCNIPVIGIIDTDCDPRLITYPIPGNDDTEFSVELFLNLFQKAILNAKERYSSDNFQETLDETIDNRDIEITDAINDSRTSIN